MERSCIQERILCSGPSVACVLLWYEGPSRRMVSSLLKEGVPVRGRSAPATGSLVAGLGVEEFWPILVIFIVVGKIV